MVFRVLLATLLIWASLPPEACRSLCRGVALVTQAAAAASKPAHAPAAADTMPCHGPAPAAADDATPPPESPDCTVCTHALVFAPGATPGLAFAPTFAVALPVPHHALGVSPRCKAHADARPPPGVRTSPYFANSPPLRL